MTVPVGIVISATDPRPRPPTNHRPAAVSDTVAKLALAVRNQSSSASSSIDLKGRDNMTMMSKQLRSTLNSCADIRAPEASALKTPTGALQRNSLCNRPRAGQSNQQSRWQGRRTLKQQPIDFATRAFAPHIVGPIPLSGELRPPISKPQVQRPYAPECVTFFPRCISWLLRAPSCGPFHSRPVGGLHGSNRGSDEGNRSVAVTPTKWVPAGP